MVHAAFRCPSEVYVYMYMYMHWSHAFWPCGSTNKIAEKFSFEGTFAIFNRFWFKTKFLTSKPTRIKLWSSRACAAVASYRYTVHVFIHHRRKIITTKIYPDSFRYLEENVHQQKFPLYGQLYVDMATINTEPVQAHYIESFGIWTSLECFSVQARRGMMRKHTFWNYQWHD